MSALFIYVVQLAGKKYKSSLMLYFCDDIFADFATNVNVMPAGTHQG
jgi:hypothetical protein